MALAGPAVLDAARSFGLTSDDWEHLFPAPCLVTSLRQREIGRSRSIYTPRTGECYPPGLGLSQDRRPLDASTLPPDPLITLRGGPAGCPGGQRRGTAATPNTTPCEVRTKDGPGDIYGAPPPSPRLKTSQVQSVSVRSF